MHYTLTENPLAATSECLVLGICADKSLPKWALKLNTTTNGLLERLSSRLKTPGDFLWQTEVDNKSLLIIHCGNSQDFTKETLRKHLKTLADTLQKQKITSATICFPPLPQTSPDAELEFMLLELDHHFYQMLEFKTMDPKPYALNNIIFHIDQAQETGLKTAEAIAKGVALTRTLANLPANIATPTYLGDQALALAKQYKNLSTKILDKKTLESLGLNALLAVGQGSAQPPCLIEMHYKGASGPPIVLVGKGITFDSGGISLKDPQGMHEMKYDMAGAAAVIGILVACHELNLSCNIIGIIASAENMPSGCAVKPGDIIKTLSGQTVEITNTDAEGRLVLADALTYAERSNPELVIDMATLTGAMIISLGHDYTGFMANDEALATAIQQAATDAHDKAWRLPLDQCYLAPLESSFADFANSPPSKSGSSLVAAAFLSRFTQKFRWAHLDIAGTAWVTGKNDRATGRPVPLLMQLLRKLSHAR